MVVAVDAQAVGSGKEKLMVILGATGTGKSRLSVDLATRFPAEIVNSDKMQFYKGLDITTNKIPDAERCGVPHHLIDCLDTESFLSADEYVTLAAGLISDITARGRVPILVGGSNSYIQALVSSPSNTEVGSDASPTFRYDCCFIWVYVEADVLAGSVRRRVDEMIANGLLSEMVDYFHKPNEGAELGIRHSIGVPEFARYFLHYPVDAATAASPEKLRLDQMEAKEKKMLEEAVEEMKLNTINLTEKQTARIQSFIDGGWDIHRMDATPAITAPAGEKLPTWGRNVLEPALEIVKKFLAPLAVKTEVTKEEGSNVPAAHQNEE